MTFDDSIIQRDSMWLLARFRCKTVGYNNLLKRFDAEQFTLLELKKRSFSNGVYSTKEWNSAEEQERP